MRIKEATTPPFSEHLRQVEELLDPIRHDRSIDDAERRRLISEVLATANAQALGLRAAEDPPTPARVPADADLFQWSLRRRRLARTG